MRNWYVACLGVTPREDEEARKSNTDGWEASDICAWPTPWRESELSREGLHAGAEGAVFTKDITTLGPRDKLRCKMGQSRALGVQVGRSGRGSALPSVGRTPFDAA